MAELQNEFCKFMLSKSKLTKAQKELYSNNKVDLRICSKQKFAQLNITKNLLSPTTSPVGIVEILICVNTFIISVLK